MLKREVQSVSYASAQITGDYPPPTPLSACSSFGIEPKLLTKHMPEMLWILFQILVKCIGFPGKYQT